MNPATNGGTMTTYAQRRDTETFKRMDERLKAARLVTMRARLVRALIATDRTPEQAENIAGACAAYDTLAAALAKVSA
jgi:hypothetical protein